MKDKYGYSSNDTEGDYESDEHIRERNRNKSQEQKRLGKAVKNRCDKCDFSGKTEAGLKGHVTKDYKRKSQKRARKNKLKKKQLKTGQLEANCALL